MRESNFDVSTLTERHPHERRKSVRHHIETRQISTRSARCRCIRHGYTRSVLGSRSSRLRRQSHTGGRVGHLRPRELTDAGAIIFDKRAAGTWNKFRRVRRSDHLDSEKRTGNEATRIDRAEARTIAVAIAASARELRRIDAARQGAQCCCKTFSHKFLLKGLSLGLLLGAPRGADLLKGEEHGDENGFALHLRGLMVRLWAGHSIRIESKFHQRFETKGMTHERDFICIYRHHGNQRCLTPGNTAFNLCQGMHDYWPPGRRDRLSEDGAIHPDVTRLRIIAFETTRRIALSCSGSNSNGTFADMDGATTESSRSTASRSASRIGGKETIHAKSRLTISSGLFLFESWCWRYGGCLWFTEIGVQCSQCLAVRPLQIFEMSR